MRIATWNVNSIRTRLDRVVAWLESRDVDVLAVQETKCTETQFPHLAFLEAGYEVVHHGVNQWNGVAVVSRIGIDDVSTTFPGQPTWGAEATAPECRALGATCGGVRIWSVYVPNGRAIGDPHMAYKLEWLGALAHAGASWLEADAAAPIAIMGDWNVAPRDEDVWDMEFYRDKSHVSPGERAGFQQVVDAGFADPVRPFAPGPGVYTYWDYQRLRFQRREGMRIDFALCSTALAQRVTHAFIDKDERRGKGASDHAPVVLDLDQPSAAR